MRKVSIPLTSVLTLATGLATVLATGLAAVPASAGTPKCLHTAPRNSVEDATGIRRIVVNAGAGSLTVHGQGERASIAITGEACATTKGLLESVQVKTSRKGDELHIVTEMPDGDWKFWNRANAHLNLRLEVPSRIDLTIEDDSGETDVSGVASLDLEDDSGGITVDDIAGDVRIQDDSGSIEVRRIGGNLTIDDDSGSITVRDVDGTVHIQDDSGSIDIEGVRGDVDIRDDSGSIDIADVGGSVRLRDSSGGIDVDNVGGDLTILEDDSGGVRYQRVAGRVTRPRE